MRNWIAKQGVRRTEPEYELRDSVEKRGCPICRLMRRTSARQLDIISYEAVNDIDLRARLRAARGFCPRHAWQFLDETHDPLGTALIYRDIINTLSALVTGEVDKGGALGLAIAALNALRPRSPRRLLGQLSPTTDCAICAAESETEDLYLSTLVRELAGSTILGDAWRASDGLCWPHLSAAGAQPRAQGVREHLVEPWVRRFGVDRQAGSAGAVVPYLLAALHGSHVAPRVALPADLIVDVQRRHLASTERPLGEVEPDCLICREVARVAPAQQAAMREPGETEALCGIHAWDSVRSGSSADLGESLQAMASQRAAELISGRWPAAAGVVRPQARRVGRWLFREECPACLDWSRRSTEAIDRLAAADSTLAPFCLGHQLLALGDPKSAARLVAARGAQVRFWRELSAELAEQIRKHDYRFRSEPRGSEQSSPWRAVDLIAGPRGVA